MDWFIGALLLIIIILGVCIFRTVHSNRPIARTVRFLLYSALIPILANLLIVLSSNERICHFAYLLYLSGTNLMIYVLLRFTFRYCQYPFARTKYDYVLRVLLVIDTVSVLLNPVFGHVFSLKHLLLNGTHHYYLLISNWYHLTHLGLTAAVIVAVFICLLYRIVKTPGIYLYRYLLILISLLIVAGWEGYYIINQVPIDVSMIGYGICGILLYYFSMEYVPLRLRNTLLSNFASNVNSAILFFEMDGSCAYANEKAREMFDIEWYGIESMAPRLQYMVGDVDIKGVDEFTVTRTITPVDGKEEKTYRIEFHKVFDKKGKLIGGFAMIEDRTDERKEREQELYDATHDSLTGIYNCDCLYDRVKEEFELHPEKEYLVITSDIREFKLINDVFGSEIGDSILINMARTIKRQLKDTAIFGRRVGDKFGLLIEKKDFHPEKFTLHVTDLSFMRDETPYQIVIHLGVYEVDDLTLPVPIMFDRADIAINSIKDDLQIRIAYYDKQMRDTMWWEQLISGSLNRALEEGQIMPYLQPQTDVAGNVVGAEVLVRWNHPAEGFLNPERFISILEKNGTIIRVDQFIWEYACKILKRWQEKDLDLYLSVNISPKDFYFMDIYKAFTALVERYEIDPKKLRLEITESVMMSDATRKIEVMEALRSYGFIMEMDDFGSGYSSLNLLKDMPLDIVKVDMVFLTHSEDMARAKLIIEFILQLAKKLGMQTVTEGVETKEQYEYLVSTGCEFFQGFYFSEPIALTDFEKKYLNVDMDLLA